MSLAAAKSIASISTLISGFPFRQVQYVARHVEQRLIRLHDRKVMVGIHVEGAQLLVEHLEELTGHGHGHGHGHDGIELILARLQLVDEQAYLESINYIT